MAESKRLEDQRRGRFSGELGGPSHHYTSEPLLDEPLEEPYWVTDELVKEFLVCPTRKKRYNELIGDDYSRADAIIAVEHRRCVEREPKMIELQRNEGSEAALRANGLEGTCYPDVETMARLKISRDFEKLAENCGLLQFLTSPQDTYYEETIQFLDTVTIHNYDKKIIGLLEREGGGYITFTVGGAYYRVTYRQIQELFGFPEGAVERISVDRNEVSAVWRLLTGRPVYIATNSKGNWIRNPVISYFRRAVAHTFFARDTTGNVNKSEAEILCLALKDILGSIDNQEMLGDVENGGLAPALAAHLADYRSRAVRQVKRRGKPRRNSIGGIACAIMRYAGVRFSEYRADRRTPNNIHFRTMNDSYLAAQRMLSRRDQNLYRFAHPEAEEAYIRLPRLDWTSLRTMESTRNAEFIPPVEYLEDPNERVPSPPPAPPSPPSHHPSPPSSPSPPLPQPFEYNPAPRVPTVQLGCGVPTKKKRETFMSKMQKGILKKLGSLVRKDKEKSKEIDALKERVRQLEGRRSVAHDRRASEDRDDYERPARHSDVGYTERHYGSESRASGNNLAIVPYQREEGDDEDILAEQGMLNWASDQEDTQESHAEGFQPFDPYNPYGDRDFVYRPSPTIELSPDPPVQYPIFPPLYRAPGGPTEEDEPNEWGLDCASRRLVEIAPMPPQPLPEMQEPRIQLRGENTYLPGSPGWLPPSVPASHWWEEVSDPQWFYRPVENMVQRSRETSDRRIPRPRPPPQPVRPPPFWHAPPEWLQGGNNKKK